MTRPFKLDARQRSIVASSNLAAKLAYETGRHAPDELVKRWTLETESVHPSIDSPSPAVGVEGESMAVKSSFAGGKAVDAGAGSRRLQACYFTLGAALDDAIPLDALMERLQNSGCTNASIFRRQPYLLVAEFLVEAPSLIDARTATANAVLKLFPSGQLIDIGYLGNSAIQALEEMSEDNFISERVLEDCLGGWCADIKPKPRDELAVVWLEAEVFEILTGLCIVHLRAADGRILVVNRRTPGFVTQDDFVEGKNYRCLVQTRFWVVVQVEPICEPY